MRAGMSAGSGKFPGYSVRANLLKKDEERVLALPQTTIMAKNWELRRETA
jgi:hypothetical protein